MKQVAYKGPRHSEELRIGDFDVVVDRSDFGKGGHVNWVEVSNEIADSLSDEWSVRDIPGKKKAGDE